MENTILTTSDCFCSFQVKVGFKCHEDHVTFVLKKRIRIQYIFRNSLKGVQSLLKMFEETFKNFTINFNALNPKVTFSGGDVVSGQVSFELSKEAKIQSIMMSLKGKANVLWHEQRQGPTSTGMGRTGRRRAGGAQGRRRTYSAELNFFSLSHIVMQTNDGRLCKCEPSEFN